MRLNHLLATFWIGFLVATTVSAQQESLSGEWQNESDSALEEGENPPVDFQSEGVAPEGESTLQGEDFINSEDADEQEYQELQSLYDNPDATENFQLGSEYNDSDQGGTASQASGLFRENTVASNSSGLKRQRVICRARRNPTEAHQNQSGDVNIDETIECPGQSEEELYAHEPVKAVDENVLTDLSQYGNDGEIVGDVDIDDDGINFGGPNDYVKLPSNNFRPTSNFSNTGITVAAWVRWSGLSGNVSGIWGGTGPGTSMLHFEFNREVDGDLRIRLDDFGGKNSNNYFLEPGIMNVGEWVHVAATYDPETCIGRLYKNGQQVKSRKECAGTIRIDDFHYLGNSSQPSAQRGWDGHIQAFTMWQDPLDKGEIESVMDGDFDPRDDRLVGYWVFGERERLPGEIADRICRDRGYEMGHHHQESAGAHQVDLYCYNPQAPENCESNGWHCTESKPIEVSNPDGNSWTEIDNDNYEDHIEPLLPDTEIKDENRPCWQAELTATCERSANQSEEVDLDQMALGSEQGLEEQFGDCEPVKSEEGGGDQTETVTEEETCLVDQDPSWDSCSASRDVSIKECPDQTQMTDTERDRAGCDDTEVCESGKCVASPDYEEMCEGDAEYSPEHGQCRVSGQCPDDSSYDSSTDRCEKDASKETASETIHTTYLQPDAETYCNGGGWHSTPDSLCEEFGYEHSLSCVPDTGSSAYLECANGKSSHTCPDGYNRDGSTCYTQPDCPTGTSYSGDNTCSGEPSWQEGCPSGTDYDGDRDNYLSSTYDRGLCVADPSYDVVTDEWDDDGCLDYFQELEEYDGCQAQTWNDWSDGGADADGGSCNASFDGLKVCEGDSVHAQLSRVPYIDSRLPTEVSVEEMTCDYEGLEEPQNRCEGMEEDPDCEQVDEECLHENSHDRLSDWCGTEERTYECEETVELEGETTDRTQYVECEGGETLVCDGQGSCTNPEQDSNDQGFKDWAAGQSMVDDMVDEQDCSGSDCRIFSGEERKCRTAAHDAIWDCCNLEAKEDAVDSEEYYEAIIQAGRESADSMLSLDTTTLVGGNLEAVLKVLVPCYEEEEELAVERKQNFTVKIGTYCDEEIDLLVGSICVQYETTFCKFDTEMARLMQEEARKQLGIGWGEPENPQCRGLTQDELKDVDWSKIPTEKWKSVMESSGSMPTEDDIQDQLPSQDELEDMGPEDLGDGNLKQDVDGVEEMESFDPQNQ